MLLSGRSPAARVRLGLVLATCCAVFVSVATADEELSRTADGAAERGYAFLTEKAYLTPDFDQETFDAVWQVWPEPLRSKAETATAEERRRMAFLRYGLTERPGGTSGKPLQYVVGDDGSWTMNCFTCHGGKVAGTSVPGSPNAHLALQTLTEEIRATKLRLKKPLARMDLGSAMFPLGTTNGTTNAVIFGIALLSLRDNDLNVVAPRRPPVFRHHDMDAPPWWHFKRRTHLYIDGFAPKGHRPLMQFMLIPQNGADRFREWEKDYRDVYAYLESIEPPDYPHAIDEDLARTGRAVFEKRCASCHGTYGERPTYPNKIVPIETVKTDRVRLDAITVEERSAYGKTWFARGHEDEVRADPGGYVAPPLDGIWASAPYLHNGSVPTLWHLMRPDARPSVWKRSANGYDRERVGLEIEVFDAVPDGVDAKERREYFDTSQHGKSAAGHRFPTALSEAQKRAVLEYLKTL